MLLIRRFLAAVLTATIPVSAVAEVPADFDGDLLSDIVYTTTSGTSLIWKSDASAAGGPELNETFGLSSDAVVLAHWLGGGLPVLGIIREDTANSTLVWKILLGAGVIQEEIFGKSGDACIAGGDFDGDGFGDAALVRAKSGRLIWEIKKNLFNAPPKSQKIPFGSVGNRVFFASPDGVRDWIGTFGFTEGGSRRTILKLRDLQSKETRSTRKIPKLLAKEPRPRPVPLGQADGSDLLVFAKADASDTTFFTYDLNGELVNKTVLSGTGTMITGEFLADDAGEEIALQVATKIRIFNPVTGGSSEQTVVSGTPVDEFTVAEVGTKATPVPTAAPTATTAPTATPG